jgi:anti-sigma B factor antagonist
MPCSGYLDSVSSVSPRRLIDPVLPRVKRCEHDDLVVLRPIGDLDITCSPRLAVDAGAEIRAGRDLIIDLTDVTFMDTTGAATLVNALRRATRARVGFAIVCPDGQPHRAMTTMRLLDTLNVAADDAAARERMRRYLPPRGASAATAPTGAR